MSVAVPFSESDALARFQMRLALLQFFLNLNLDELFLAQLLLSLVNSLLF